MIHNIKYECNIFYSGTKYTILTYSNQPINSTRSATSCVLSPHQPSCQSTCVITSEDRRSDVTCEDHYLRGSQDYLPALLTLYHTTQITSVKSPHESIQYTRGTHPVISDLRWWLKKRTMVEEFWRVLRTVIRCWNLVG